jgi:hypothetical protein
VMATMPSQGKMFLFLARMNRGAQHDWKSLSAIVSIYSVTFVQEMLRFLAGREYRYKEY